jgi:probable nitrogen fixation protein
MDTENTILTTSELFYENLVKQIRSIDSYGTYSKYSDSELIDMKYLKSPVDPSAVDKTGTNIKFYLQAAAITLEKLEGNIIGLMTESGCDGSVKAMFYTGQLILLEKTFGSISGFNFGTVEKLTAAGAKLLDRMRNTLAEKKENYKELMG